VTGSAALPADLEAAVAFHGHLCPGLLIGYRAAKAAAAALDVGRSEDEDLVLVTENSSCSADAFQSLLSTTFGKGNLHLEDNGKQVFTLGDRATGKAVRVALRFDAFDAVGADRDAKIDRLLSAETEDLFHLNPVRLKLPDKAQVLPTVRCARCHEGAMVTRTVTSGEEVYCLPCARDLGLVSDGL
jgi:formylmethanofuran dehydrogenase subunit E